MTIEKAIYLTECEVLRHEGLALQQTNEILRQSHFEVITALKLLCDLVRGESEVGA